MFSNESAVLLGYLSKSSIIIPIVDLFELISREKVIGKRLYMRYALNYRIEIAHIPFIKQSTFFLPLKPLSLLLCICFFDIRLWDIDALSIVLQIIFITLLITNIRPLIATYASVMRSLILMLETPNLEWGNYRLVLRLNDYSKELKLSFKFVDLWVIN